MCIHGLIKKFDGIIISQSSFFPLAASAVPTEAAYAAIDDLDSKKHHLHHAQPQDYGEENDVPKDYILRVHTERPQWFIHQVTAVTCP